MDLEQPSHVRDWTPEEIRDHPVYGKIYPEAFEEIHRDVRKSLAELAACFGIAMGPDRRPLEEQLHHKEEAYQRWLTTVHPGPEDGAVPGEGGRE